MLRDILDLIGTYAHMEFRMENGILQVKKKRCLYYYSIFFREGGYYTKDDCAVQ